jgi:hypothetical protein
VEKIDGLNKVLNIGYIKGVLLNGSKKWKTSLNPIKGFSPRCG